MPPDLLTRAAGRIAASLDRRARTVEAVALSGLAPAVRPGPAPDGSAGPWVEELAAGGADLASLVGAPVLLDHVPTTRTSVGTVTDARVEGDRILCRLRFDDSPEADAVMGKVAAGSVRGVSLGYLTEKRQRSGTDAAGRPIFRAVAWTPVELSLTPLPVDPGAPIRGHAMPDSTPAAPADATAQDGFKPCPDCTNPAVCSAAGACFNQPPAAGDGAAATPAATTRAVRSIAGLAGLGADWADRQIDARASTDQVRAAAFSEMQRRSRGAVTIDNRSPHISGGIDYSDPAMMRRSMADALAHRLAPAHCKLEGQAIQFRSHGPLALLGQLLGARGERVNPWDREGLLVRAIGAHSTSDFPLLLADAANKALLTQYQAAAPTYRQIAARKPFNDFKAHKFLRLGDFPGFQDLAESGPVKYGTISEKKEEITSKAFATGIAINREALLNDDLSALADFSGLLAVRSAQFENAKVYDLIASTGPTMSDGNAMFHTAHGNYQGTGTTIANGIDAAVQAFRSQTGLDGAKINVEPKFLVVGPAKEVEARKQLAAVNPTSTAEVNVWASAFTLVVDSEITGNAWHLAANPAQVPNMVYGYVSGAEGPQILTERDFDSQAVKVRAGLDFACGAVDWKGLYKSAGA